MQIILVAKSKISGENLKKEKIIFQKFDSRFMGSLNLNNFRETHI